MSDVRMEEIRARAEAVTVHLDGYQIDEVRLDEDGEELFYIDENGERYNLAESGYGDREFPGEEERGFLRMALEVMLLHKPLAARVAALEAELGVVYRQAIEDAAKVVEDKAREVADAATCIDDDYSQFLFEVAVSIREQVKR